MREYIRIDPEDLEIYKMLIKMTNLYIDYRNQVWDGVVNLNTGIVDSEEDRQDIAAMDRTIDEIVEYLGDG
jgi:hypothetical protein